MTAATNIVTSSAPANAIVQIQPGMAVQPVVLVDQNGQYVSSGGGFANPMTTLGDIIYENGTPAAARLAGSTSATKQFLTQAGNGSVSAAPAWGAIARADLPNPVKSVTTTNTTASTDCVTLCSASGGTWVNTLPDATTVPAGQPYFFKKTDTTANEVTLQPVSAQTIDGGTYLALAVPYTSVSLLSDGTNWWSF